MKPLLLTAIFTLGVLGLVPASAHAFVCGNGVWRAGCAGPNGAVVVRRPYVAPPRAYYAPPPRAYYAPRRPVACANGVFVAGCVGPRGGVGVVVRP
jgi:hypothetical protein